MVRRITGETAPPMPLGRPPLSPARSRRSAAESTRAHVKRSRSRGEAKVGSALALEVPRSPLSSGRDWTAPVDRFLAGISRRHGIAPPELIGDAAFARRAYLDSVGIAAPPEDLQAFSHRNPNKRPARVQHLLADDDKYAQHWISFWNDLLRKKKVSTITQRRHHARASDLAAFGATTNVPYNRWVEQLLNPTR